MWRRECGSLVFHYYTRATALCGHSSNHPFATKKEETFRVFETERCDRCEQIIGDGLRDQQREEE